MEDIKQKWLHEKLKTRSFVAAACDYLLIYIIYQLAIYFLDTESLLHLFSVTWIGVWLINVILMLSRKGATLGMMMCGIKYQDEDDKSISFSQIFKALLCAPTWLIISSALFATSLFGAPSNYYSLYNLETVCAVILAITYYVYVFKYGDFVNAKKSMIGIDTVFTSKKSLKLDHQFNHKSEKSLRSLEKWIKVKRHLSKAEIIIGGTFFIYMASLVIMDLPKTAKFEKEFYAPYALNWGKDNAFFAVEGLTAPEDTADFYEFGRAKIYQYFTEIEQNKKKLNYKYQFPIPPKQDFLVVDTDAKPVQFISSKNGNEPVDFQCLYMFESASKDKCATFEDVDTAIQQNRILWDRFNKLPDYKSYQLIPKNLQGRHPQEFIDLMRLKAAHIIKLQNDGDSKAALDEWVRYMNFYQLISNSRSNPPDKAVHMIAVNIQLRMLEKLLYNDPLLARDYQDVIRKTLNPRGIEMFHGQTMIVDSFKDLDLEIQFNLDLARGEVMDSTGYAPGVRNKIYDCALTADKHSLISPKDFILVAMDGQECSFTKGVMESFLVMSFLTTGNIITNNSYGIIGYNLLTAQPLVSNMHIIDTHMRMAILGTKILNEQVPLADIESYIKKAPKDLQNPITESPFLWDAKDKYLYFINPTGSQNPIKFQLNI